MALAVTRVQVVFEVTCDPDKVSAQFITDEVDMMLGDAADAGLMCRKAFHDLTYGDIEVTGTRPVPEDEED